jgi:3',5'-cyclic AMP phosphodiesterase CpdA
MFTVAHFSDPHLAGWHSPGPAGLLSKRFFGFLSWRLRRRRIHLTPILDRLVADIKVARPDHTVITGDIVNLSLPEEFARATRWLESLGSPDDLTVIPGNHDAYIELPWETTIGQWRPWMTDDAGSRPKAMGGPDGFPFVRLRNRIALVGSSSACPMPIGSAGGRLGPAQLDRLRTCLTDLRQRDLCRVLLIHHPPFEDPKHRRKELEDIAGLREVIAETGVELILHGHTHRSSLQSIPVPGGTAPVIGVASASARAWKSKDPARYHLYRIDRNGPSWRINVEIRSLDSARTEFVHSNSFNLTLPATGKPAPGSIPEAAE